MTLRAVRRCLAGAAVSVVAAIALALAGATPATAGPCYTVEVDDPNGNPWVTVCPYD